MRKLAALILFLNFIVVSAPAEIAVPAIKTSFSGFLDARYTSYRNFGGPNATQANSESGFGIEDGAFFLTLEKAQSSVFFEIPFRRSLVSDDLNPGASNASPRASNSSAIAFGLDKAQLYGRFKITPATSLLAGQFATIFGVEGNDSKDRSFNKTGLVYDFLTPVTHTGILFENAQAGRTTKAFAANPNNKGSNGDGSAGGDKTEIGLTVGYSTEQIHSQVGLMSRPVPRANKDGNAIRNFADVIFGGNLERLSLDLEYSLVDDPGKNVLTPNDPTDREEPGSALLALVGYKMGDSAALFLRYEHLHADPAGDPNMLSADSYGASLHYYFDRQFEIRVEMTGYAFTRVAGSNWTSERFNTGTLFYF